MKTVLPSQFGSSFISRILGPSTVFYHFGWLIRSRDATAVDFLLLKHLHRLAMPLVWMTLWNKCLDKRRVEVREKLLMFRSNSFSPHLLSCSFYQFLPYSNTKIQVQPPLDQGHLRSWKEVCKSIHIPPSLSNICSHQKDGMLLFLKSY